MKTRKQLTKLASDKLNMQRSLYSRPLQQGREAELNSFETKGGEVFKHWDELGMKSLEGHWWGGRSR